MIKVINFGVVGAISAVFMAGCSFFGGGDGSHYQRSERMRSERRI